jgi:preprotein translocase subunit YajC
VGHTSLLMFLQGQPGGGMLGGLVLPMIFVFGVFYFLIIRPQQKKQKQAQAEREQLLNSLKPGDKVVTSGGIYGTIVAVKEDTVQLRIAQSISIVVTRSAVAGPQPGESKESDTAKS